MASKSLSAVQGGLRERREEGGTKPCPPAARKPPRENRKAVGGAAGVPVHYIVLPALLLGGVAVAVYFGEAWWAGPGVNKPLPLPPAVSDVWRNKDVYLTRLWGTYR